MIKFCYDQLIDGVGYPNLAKWAAVPKSNSWHQFDSHWPKTVPLRLLMYLDSNNIRYKTHTVADAPIGSWYPIALSWFDFDCDYFSLIPIATVTRIRSQEIKILVYYHEGDNPARIKNRLDQLCTNNALTTDCYKFISANSAADHLDNCIYFPEHESFFRYVNRKQACVNPLRPERDHDFTMLNRTHKWWRASCTVDVLDLGLLKNSLWSYNTDCSINDDPDDNPLELDSVPNWRQRVKEFVSNGPYSCDEFDPNQQNDHHFVNQVLYTTSYFHIVTETHFDADQSPGTFITEKTYKCLKYGQPFVVVGPAGTLAELRHAGYKTFDNVLDNSYDTIVNNTDRWLAIRKLLVNMYAHGLESLSTQCQPDVGYNQRLFDARAVKSLNNLLEKITWHH